MDFDYRLLAKYLTGMLSPEEMKTYSKVAVSSYYLLPLCSTTYCRLVVLYKDDR